MPVEAIFLAAQEKRREDHIALPHRLTALTEKPLKQKLEPVSFLDVPLKIDFQLRRLSRDNQNEATLRTMIDGFAGQTDDAFLVPIFGRGAIVL